MRRSRWTGVWVVFVAVLFTQGGVNGDRLAQAEVSGPSQGTLPSAEAVAATGGGGGGPEASPSPESNVIPVLPGNPWGLDAVPAPSPSPAMGGGGGGPVEAGVMDGPFIRVLPGGDAADWTRSPSPSPTGRPRVL